MPSRLTSGAKLVDILFSCRVTIKYGRVLCPNGIGGCYRPYRKYSTTGWYRNQSSHRLRTGCFYQVLIELEANIKS